MEWYSYVVAVILLISSIVSPIITTLINNHHQIKVKKIEMYEEAKQNALSNFIECAEDYLLNLNFAEQSVKYYSALNKLFIYFYDISLDTFIPFDEASKNTNNYSTASIELTKIVQTLSKQIKKK